MEEEDELKNFACMCTYYISDTKMFVKLAKVLSNEELASGLDDMVERTLDIIKNINPQDREKINNNCLGFYKQFLEK